MSKRDELAQVILDRAVDHPMWIGGDGEPLDYLPEREGRIGDFVHETADAVLAWLGWVLDPLLTAADIVLAEADEEDREDPNLDELAYCAKAVVAWLGLSNAAQDAQDGAVGPGSVPMGTGEGAAPNGAQIEDFEGER